MDTKKRGLSLDQAIFGAEAYDEPTWAGITKQSLVMFTTSSNELWSRDCGFIVAARLHDTCFIQRVGVLRAHRKLGHSRRLVEKVCDHVHKTLGIKRIRLHLREDYVLAKYGLRLNTWVEALGFKFVGGRSDVEWNYGRWLDMYDYEKIL